jgi:hypothetical protein
LAKVDSTLRTMEMIHELQFEDVEEFKIDYSAVSENKSIGFKQNKN